MPCVVTELRAVSASSTLSSTERSYILKIRADASKQVRQGECW